MNYTSNNSLKKMNIYKWIGLFLILITVGQAEAQQIAKKKSPKSDRKVSTIKTSAYLFSYFTGNSKDDEAIRFAVSNDGYNFRALNNNQPIIDSKKISSSPPSTHRLLDGQVTSLLFQFLSELHGHDPVFGHFFLSDFLFL